MTNHTLAVVGGIAGAFALMAVLGVAAERRQRETPKIPVRADEAKIMAVIDKLTPTIGPMLNVPPEDGQALRIFAEAIGAKNIVEIGMSNGYSGLWFCLALKNTGGKLTTFDIDPEKVKMATANFKEAGVDSMVTIIHGDAHKEVANLKGPIDLVFIDADKEGYGDYLKKLLPLVRPGGIIMAHNTTGQGGQMRDFIEGITTNPDLATTFINTSDRGMSVTVKKHPAK